MDKTVCDCGKGVAEWATDGKKSGIAKVLGR